MNKTHTPPPYSYHLDENTVESDEWQDSSGDPVVICELVGGNKEKNGKFIVKACNNHNNLIDVLKKAYNLIDSTAYRIQGIHILLSRELSNFLPTLESAISKGEQNE